MRDGRAAMLTALLLTACATTPKGTASSSGWVEVQTPHLHIRAQLDEAAAIEVARSMEAVRSGLTAFWGPDFAPDDRLDVLLFRDHASLADFAPHAVRGFLADTPSGPWMVSSLTAYEDSSFQIVQAHELAHHLGAYVMLRQPRWLNEGLATYLETLELDRAASEVVFGKPPASTPSTAVSLAALWQWDVRPIPPEETYAHTANAWRLVHHLLAAHPEQFAAFRTRLGAGMDPRAAWDQSGFTDGALEAELATSTARLDRKPLRLEPLEPVVAPMSQAEVHAVRATLLAHSAPVERLRVVGREIEAALALEPGNERALILEAWLIVDSGKRIAFLRNAIPQLPQSGRLLATLAANVGLIGEDPRAMLRRALALDPRNPNALNDLAWYEALAGEGSTAVELARRAVAQRPWSHRFVTTYALALAAAGRCAEAADRMRQARDLAGHSTLEKNFEILLAAYEQGCTPDRPLLPTR